MNRLFGMRTYLVGAMDRVADGGVEWRENITPFLNSYGIVVFDPCKKPLHPDDALAALETPEARKSRAEAKAGGDLQRAAREMKPVRATDLRMVDITDFLIVNIDIDVHACGTYEEITTANRQRKPILIHVEGGRVNTPDWLLAVLGEKAVDEMVFDTWADMRDYLRKINMSHPNKLGQLNLHKRWVFFDLERINNDALRGYTNKTRT